MFVYLTLNVVLAGLVFVGVVGLLVGSVATQHHDPGWEHGRLARGRSVYDTTRIATAADAEQGQPSPSEASPSIALRDQRLVSSKPT